MSNLKTAVVEHKGETYHIKYKAITRYLRNQAMEVGAVKAQERFGKNLPMPSEMEYYLACEIIKGGLPDDRNVRIWWVENEDFELGDKITRAVGIESAMTSFIQDTSKEVQAAKNSSSDEASQ